MEKVPEAGYRIEGLPVAGFQRRLTLKNITFFFRLLVSMWRSRRIVSRFRPHAAVGVGGYASGPVLKSAARKKVPILIQEQNSYAGVTNRLLARSAQTICVAYEKMERYFPGEKIVLTGNPVRRSLTGAPVERAIALDTFGLDPGKKVCLVMGGSLGARSLNRGMLAGLKRLDRDDLQILWQCGKFYRDEVTALVEQSGLSNVVVRPFISEMDHAYSAADVIISRAGALTISELCLVGKPVILVPSPNVAEDHQTRNAEALVSKRAALMVPDQQAREHLVEQLLKLVDNEPLQKRLATEIKTLGKADAAEQIAGEVMKLIEKE
jgi:UDP-N-acetylglucosamine--N-acetylmuramyl-(pentapeptide) pyrophosphoryl-undecaprenol N-acetylglucosamine transferase